MAEASGSINVQNDIRNTESMLFEMQILLSKISLRVNQTKKYIQNHKLTEATDIKELTRPDFIVYDIIKSIQILYGILSQVVGQYTGNRVKIDCTTMSLKKLEQFLDDTMHITNSLQWYTDRFLQDIRRRFTHSENESFETTFYDNKDNLLYLMFATCKQLCQIASPYLSETRTTLKQAIRELELKNADDNLPSLTASKSSVNDIRSNKLDSVSSDTDLPVKNSIDNLPGNLLPISKLHIENSSTGNSLPVSNVPVEKPSTSKNKIDDFLQNMQDSLSRNMCDDSHKLHKILNDPYIYKYEAKTLPNVHSDMWHGLITEDGIFFFNRYNKQFSSITNMDVKDVDFKLVSNKYESFQSAFNFPASFHVLEVYNFPTNFSTNDIELTFYEYFKGDQAEFHWVTETSGILVLKSVENAKYILSRPWPNLRVRSMENASKMVQSKCWILGLDEKTSKTNVEW